MSESSSSPTSASSRIVRAWLLTALLDGLFSSLLARFAYGSTVTRLWQGVAYTLLGPSALEGGLRTALVGVAMHIGVALGWTIVFYLAYAQIDALRRLAARPGGVLAIAAVYGPVIWLVMSLLVIPVLTGKPTAFTVRWLVQLVGHIPFVAWPIVASLAHRGEKASHVEVFA